MSILHFQGTGLFLGSGKAIARAGPLGAFLGYLFVGILVTGPVFSIAEMSALVPLSGGVIRHAEYFVDVCLPVRTYVTDLLMNCSLPSRSQMATTPYTAAWCLSLLRSWPQLCSWSSGLQSVMLYGSLCLACCYCWQISFLSEYMVNWSSSSRR